MQSDGYWINRDGEILKLSTSSHIAQIIGYPEKFGLTKADIAAAYTKSGERHGSEGRAREELILTVLKKGFIRVRSYVNSWSITVQKLGSRERFALQEWAQEAMKNRYTSIHSEVNIYEVYTDRQLKYKMQDFLSGAITEGSIKDKGFNPRLVRSILEWKTYNRLGLFR